jgi:hypothetical protein
MTRPDREIEARDRLLIDSDAILASLMIDGSEECYGPAKTDMVANAEAYAIGIINAHVPSLTEANEEEINNLVLAYVSPIAIREDYTDVADFCIRTCSCGMRIDGIYQYIDHLVALFGGESHLGG